jgi:lipopolysaccharide transport system ATP-binding protein
MSDIAIRVKNLGKLYRLGPRERYQALRDKLTDAMTMPFRAIRNWGRPSGGNQPPKDFLWALKDVSLEIKRGEAVGIIGRNGAGKSTLLKILSRITEPTEGFAEIRGRVGSLLEVGTGFHPELTGRENIYLNGAILGMKKTEIVRKFDEIVAFAEIEKFLDTPVKHYSSGMYVRLAFAVAAHLEPEILLVDEVLAVGDAAFQKKCLGKMGDVTKQGRTVLFVSHNMGAIAQLCPKSVLLRSGRVDAIDESNAIVAKYLSESLQAKAEVQLDPERAPLLPAVFTHFWIADEEGAPISAVDVTKAFNIGISIFVRREVPGTDVSLQFRNKLSQPLFTSNLSDSVDGFTTLAEGKQTFLIKIPAQFLAPDTYSLLCAIHRPGIQLFDVQDGVFSFQVIESGSSMWQHHGQAYGNILVRFPWQSTTAKI